MNTCPRSSYFGRGIPPTCLSRPRTWSLHVWRGALMVLLCGIVAGQALTAQAATKPRLIALAGSVPSGLASAQQLGAHRLDDQLTMSVLLQPSHQDQMDQLTNALYDRNSPLYHHWLSTGAFDRLFGPSREQRAQLTQFLTAAGLSISQDAPSAFVVQASGSTRQIEAALGTSINDYRSLSGETFYANSTPVLLPAALSPLVIGVLGLTSRRVAFPHIQRPASGNPHYGGGPGLGGLTPSQIASIYDATAVYTKLKEKGEGETLGLFELSGYTPADITVYENTYHLRHVPLQERNIDGGPTDAKGAAEVELDIEMMVALAPGVKRILVYNAPGDDKGFIDQLLRIAKDNAADAMSTSYGTCEDDVLGTPAFYKAEDLAYHQMAMQGQSAFTAAGDSGAFDCSQTSPGAKHGPVVDDSSSPFVTSVGGTSFKGTFDPGANAHPSYPKGKEHIWNTNCQPDKCNGCPEECGGGGGGVSKLWAMPRYQKGRGVIEQRYSRSGAYCRQKAGVFCREVPDVSINADPDSGYSVYCSNKAGGCAGWAPIGGTSAGAPLWAALTALMDNDDNQRFGLLNYFFYGYDSPQGYQIYLHDITHGTNGFYPAGRAYDMASGLGTPDIYQLIQP